MSDSPPAVLHEELQRLLARAEVLRQPGTPTKIASLAKAINRSQASVYAYFQGITVPSAGVLDDILTAFGIRRHEEVRRFHELRDDAAIARKRNSRSRNNRAAEVIENLPGRSKTFVGRDTARLARLVAAHGQVAIHGDGGVGKTEFALQYAHASQQREHLQVSWWINAGSARQIMAGLAELARRIYPDEPRGDTAAAGRAMAWLRSNQRWLLILDNVTSFADVTGMLSELRDSGSVLLTTRLDPGTTQWRHLGLRPLSLGALDREDGVTLLLARTGSADHDGARLLAEQAGDLPLALCQAAAFVAQHPGTGFREYRQQLADEIDRHATSGDSGRTIAATWTMAMRRASAAAPLSAEIMSVLSYLAEMPLPEDVLETLGQPADVAHALDSLAAYRIIDLNGSGITTHRLVLAAARTADSRPAEHRAAAATLLDSVISPDPLADTDDWPRWRTLIPHIEALTARLPAEEQSARSVHLRERFASFLQGQGNVTRAIAILESVVADAERTFGRQHPDTLDYTANLAQAYVAAARISPALAILEDLVPRYLETLGPAHSDTLVIRAVLANAYRLRGHLDTAAELLEQVIADADGTTFDVETGRTQLAAAYTDAGRLDEAIALLRQVYARQCLTLGSTKLPTLVTRHNLARVLREAGQTDEAMSELRAVLAIQSAAFGVNNPNTLTTRGNLALTEQALGQIDAAIADFDALLLDTQEALGQEHPATLTTVRYLANAHLASGDARVAIALLERAVTEHQRLLGDLEPLTFLARRDLAVAYRQAADSVADALLNDQMQVLGP